MEEIELCLNNVKAYAVRHDEYVGDMNIATSPEFALKWKVCTEILGDKGFIYIFNDSINFDDCYDSFSKLGNLSGSGIVPPADEIYLDYDVSSWLKCIDSKWSRLGMCIGGIDLKEDNYALFVCARAKLDNLIKLAEKVGRVIKRSSEL